MDDISCILYLFDRPTEPIYVPKGQKKVAFDIPSCYRADKFSHLADDVVNRFAEDTKSDIKVHQMISLPNFDIPLQLGRRESFSHFIPEHQKMAGRLIKIFMEMSTFEDLLSVAVYCRERMNPTMFIYALAVALLHREDTKNLPIPPLSEIFPEKYIDGSILARATEEAHLVEDPEARVTLEIPMNYTASDLDEEHRVAYWREDLGINLHHWHWHLVYPVNGELKIVDKDRRGELFYYMHQQIMARYNFERLCNRLSRVKRFINFEDPIPEGYFPKLDARVSGKTWPARHAGARLRDINRPVDRINFDIQDLVRWRDRIYEAIHIGAVTNEKGERVPLDEKKGINTLGNMLEASSVLSPNYKLYGNLHNSGHIAVSYCHDPDHSHLETSGIMNDTATAMRDPFFYRWHAFIDGIFQEHKNTLPAYTTQQLNFQGVRITGLEVVTPSQPNKNTLSTFWQQSDVDLSRGIDWLPSGGVRARFTHLNHAEYKYRIRATNDNDSARKGTVRIFMAPKLDERGLPCAFNDQRMLMIEMDKFTVELQPGDNNIIARSSVDSSVTIPFERTFRKVDENKPIGGDTPAESNFCGCGWPQHMLIPRGNRGGVVADLFVMISDYKGDEVPQDTSSGCKDAASYCGIKDNKYPDARSMGYPFDRRPRDGVNTLGQFITANMAATDVIIRFNDIVVPPVVRPATMTNAV